MTLHLGHMSNRDFAWHLLRQTPVAVAAGLLVGLVAVLIIP